MNRHGGKEKYQPLYQKLVLNMAEAVGFEPTDPSLWITRFRVGAVMTTSIRFHMGVSRCGGEEPTAAL